MGWRRAEVESVVIDRAFWLGRRVLLTGHTGFKGAWMTLMLRALGAQVTGLALPPDDPRDLFEVVGLAKDIHHCLGDVRELDVVNSVLREAKPSIVLHLAAQPLVRVSYIEPVDTFATNIMGTVHLLEAARRTPGIEAVVVVTSDKCYDNQGLGRGFRESDAMGGHDPYSSSKGCAELVTAAYRHSFFREAGSAQLATARAGNVIGGGDWSRDRLVPDIMHAIAAGEVVRIRYPQAVRPWQHVLDPLIGYLVLAQRLAGGAHDAAEAWNFGPGSDSEVSVAVLVEYLVKLWGPAARWELDRDNHPHEAAILKLDCGKAQTRLSWRPLIGFAKALEMTVAWYRAFAAGDDMRAFTQNQVEDLMDKASSRS
jgi:CDP-glucose 4,6-dehydratase